MNICKNRRFAERWHQMRLNEALQTVVLQQDLLSVIRAPFIRKEGCLIFGHMVNTNLKVRGHHDRTDYQAAVNELHIEDYLDPPVHLRDLLIQGVKAAMELASRLKNEGPYQVVVSFQEAEYIGANLRFYERRPGEYWIANDIEEYESEDIFVIDT